MAILRAQLSPYARRAGIYKRASRAQAETDIFLSHSHRDADIVQAAVRFLAEQGISVYVDWMDPGMPSETSPATAARIKQKIDANRKFVLLVTENSRSSRWVPWELGCADGIRGLDHMAILAVEDRAGALTGSEYLGLYAQIWPSNNNDWVVVNPGEDRGPRLRDWLSS